VASDTKLPFVLARVQRVHCSFFDHPPPSLPRTECPCKCVWRRRGRPAWPSYPGHRPHLFDGAGVARRATITAASQAATAASASPTPRSSAHVKAAHACKPLACFTSRRIYSRFIARLQKLEAQAQSSRRRKPITEQLSHKVLRPMGSYDSERYALD
jgi:hypothetical protein